MSTAIERYKKIAIHGVPRSGTSWLGEIINSSPHTRYKFQPLFSYALKDYLTPASTRQDIEEFFSLLASTSDEFLDQSEKRERRLLPVFRKERFHHVVYKEVRYHNILHNLMRKADDVNLICLVRNPLSVINSWLLAPKEFRADLGWVPADEWRYALKKNLNKPEEFNGFEKWKVGTRIFLCLKNTYPDRVCLVEYRKLVEETRSEVERVFRFCGLPVSDQTRRFIHESKMSEHADAYAVYRKSPDHDAWRKSLDPRIIREIVHDLKGTDLERFLYFSSDDFTWVESIAGASS